MKALGSAALAIAVGLVMAASGRADACGGFFCSNVPIDQAGERIAFSVEGDKIEAHVQIQYTGDAKQFSWVVPVHSLPELAVGSPQLFTFLSQATVPQFITTFTGQNACFGFARGAGAPTAAEDSGNANVSVISRADVGPYDAAILQATEASALSTWLTDNGYQLTPAGSAALAPYMAPGYYFVALKLQQDKSVGDLRPIVLKMQGTPCIPIRLTAIAAAPNMPIIAYVFADHRAAPQNYRHVLINEAKMDWLRGGFNYSQVATAAVDEAGGKAFLTEFAGAVSTLNVDSLRSQLAAYNTEALRAFTDPILFADAMVNQGLSQDPASLNLLRKYIPMPKSMVNAGFSDAVFYNRLESYRSEIESDPDRAPFDPIAFADELQSTIVTPLAGSLKLFDRPYLTRLFTTMSADEMTVDPEFHFNPGLADVSNVHRATATFAGSCASFDDRFRIELSDGRWFYQSFQGGPVTAGPSAQRWEDIPASGPPVVLVDNTAIINRALRDVGGGHPGGCSCQSVDAAGALLGLLALSTRLFRRRRQ